MNDTLAETLHGGARRMPLRWLNAAQPPMRIARYRVEPGEVVSPHVHTGKAEHWLVVRGHGVARVGEEEIAVAEGDVVTTLPSIPHSLSNTGTGVLEFVNFVEPTGGAITTTEIAA